MAEVTCGMAASGRSPVAGAACVCVVLVVVGAARLRVAAMAGSAIRSAPGAPHSLCLVYGR